MSSRWKSLNFGLESQYLPEQLNLCQHRTESVKVISASIMQYGLDVGIFCSPAFNIVSDHLAICFD
jgi:hypothetical protein